MCLVDVDGPISNDTILILHKIVLFIKLCRVKLSHLLVHNSSFFLDSNIGNISTTNINLKTSITIAADNILIFFLKLFFKENKS